MIKEIGQLLFAATMMQLFPTDAAYLQWQAQAGAGLEPEMSVESYLRVLEGLPIADDRFSVPEKVNEGSFGIVTSARSAIVVDKHTGTVLFAKQPESIRSIGSVTKLMTALVFLEQNPDLHQIVDIDAETDYVGGGRRYLRYATGVRLEDVLATSLVGSDNTATQSLVRFSGLTEEAFIERMNTLAVEIGMEDASFVDPTGIQLHNMASAFDLVMLLRAAEANPYIHQYSTSAQVTVDQLDGYEVTIENTNGLLAGYLNSDPYDFLVSKTGFLPAARYVLTGGVEYEGDQIYIVVLGADSKVDRELEFKGLAEWTYQTYRWN